MAFPVGGRKRKSSGFSEGLEEENDAVLYKDSSPLDFDETNHSLNRQLLVWQNQTQGSAAALAGTALVPRYERKQRRREMMDDCSSLSSSSDPNDDKPPENAFAALESLLASQPAIATENIDDSCHQLAINETCAPISMMLPEETPPEPEITAFSDQFDTIVPPAYQDTFALNEAGDPPVECTVDVPPVGPTEQQPTSFLSPDKVMPTSGDGLLRHPEASRPAVLLDDNVNHGSALLEKSRCFMTKQSKSTALNDVSLVVKKGPKKNPKSRPVAAVDSRSIVGSRPRHWRAPSAMVSARGNRRGGKSQLAAELAKATKSHSSLLSSAPQTKMSSFGSTIRPTGVGSVSDPSHSNSLYNKNPISPYAAPAPVSFTPAFVSTRPQTSMPDAEEVLEANRSFTMDEIITPRHFADNGMVSPPPKKTAPRKSKNKVGPLAKRLKSIRDGIKGDTIRFQSGQYPFTGRAAFELNDPRNRAKSHMDVTIVGNAVAWDAEYQRVSVLGCIHTYVSRGIGKLGVSKDSFAWICFTYETAREQNLCIGTQLRIYNAVISPLPEIPTDTPCRVCIKYLVACSQLCEVYPTALPRLPAIASICAEHNLAAPISEKEAVMKS